MTTHVAHIVQTVDGPRGGCSCGWQGVETLPATGSRSPQQAEALTHVAEYLDWSTR